MCERWRWRGRYLSLSRESRSKIGSRRIRHGLQEALQALVCAVEVASFERHGLEVPRKRNFLFPPADQMRVHGSRPESSELGESAIQNEQ